MVCGLSEKETLHFRVLPRTPRIVVAFSLSDELIPEGSITWVWLQIKPSESVEELVIAAGQGSR